MAQDINVVNFSARQPSQRFLLPNSLVGLRDVSGQSLRTILANFFDRSDDALFELADRAGTNTDQNTFFDAMRELRLRRKSMVVSVLQYVSQAFNDIGRFHPEYGSGALDDVDQDSLSLLDHSQLEQQVAVDNLINKLRSHYSEQIRLLTTRVNHLIPETRLSDSQMPLSPEVICGGVAEACSDLDIDIRAKLVVLKLFDRLLEDSLGGLYEQANRKLADDGVMPDLKRAPVGPGKASRSAKKPSGFDAGAGEDSSMPQATFSELSALLHQSDGGASQSSFADGVELDTSRLMARLSKIQVASGRLGAGRVIALNDLLKPVLRADTETPFNVGQVDNDVINLVSMLFDFILEDRQLHPVMKSLIGRLQIPVLKVALSDRNFFNRGGHPVRKLLNELALSAIGWSEKREGQKDPLRDKIEQVVGRILNEFTNNVELFEELLKDFSHFMDLDRRRRELIEQRLKDAEEGRARQEYASTASNGLIEEVIVRREIPEPVLKLLREPWAKYLQWVILREGDESQRWDDARKLTERLVWSVDPKPVTDDTRSELLRAIPSIVDDLRRALQEISWDPFATDSAIHDLELAHVDVFQKLVTAPPRDETLVAEVESETETETDVAAAAIEDVSVGAVAENEVVPAETAEDVAPAAVAGEWLGRADSLRVGSWIEMTRDETRIRCKLAAFIKATGKYIFVNRSGAKVAEYQREELAAAMAEGEIGMLDDGLIFDRALESIIDNLRSNRRD
ncbi:DUF1631 domain-containing protein [Marinobacter salinexigens]|uniref:DUF1631 domain-containing protein n=1 Tax=Marinobacter salinexigens TaxID=2919747 RepID=A0A5B0VH72_9GAMM|nr:DUF1631 domain-containing protein [Marinobacter salinexigens]KAA1174007.1 DUF1631 domain-containing protein [Marinobacter salinexigens]